MSYIEIFIKNKCDEISADEAMNVNKFLPFYSDISNDDLGYLFSYLHYKFNSLFQFMNNKINVNNHYNADESRELIAIIDKQQQLIKTLKDTEYDFNLNDEYLQIINKCNIFLSGSGGSRIPEEFEKIDIIEAKPIITLKLSTTKVNTVIEKDKQIKPMQKTKVFIVHGHDNESKQEVARFVESIGLEAIILHEKASSGMTIIEKIEHYSNESEFAIVLYTPCDKGRGAKETTIPAKNRARQNVVFEHGYLMARLGRKNVCALVKGDIETPNDISGVVYVSLDKTDAWKIEISKELKACGYNIKAIV